MEVQQTVASSSLSAQGTILIPATVRDHLQFASSNPDSEEATKLATSVGVSWLLELYMEDTRLLHWYCGQDGAEELRGLSVLLVKLFSYKRVNEIDSWRNHHDVLMSTCSNCVHQFQSIKLEFKHQYLDGIKSEKNVDNFMLGIEKIESARITKYFLDSTTPVPSSIIYDFLINPLLYQNETVIGQFQNYLSSPSTDFHSLISDKVLPGLLALIMNPSERLVKWSQYQLEHCLMVEDVAEYRSNNISAIIETHLEVINARDSNNNYVNSEIVIAYSPYKASIWNGIGIILNLLSPAIIKSHLAVDVVKLVTTHLGDEDVHLVPVIQCFATLLEKLSFSFWSKDGTTMGEEALGHYVQSVLAAILDNSTFESSFVSLVSSPNDPSASSVLNWIQPFLISVSSSSESFTKSLAFISSIFLSRYQSNRYSVSSRTIAIESTLTMFAHIFLDDDDPETLSSGSSSPTPTLWRYAQSASKTLDLHSQFLAQLAFGPEYRIKEWSTAHAASLDFTRRIFHRDSKQVVEKVFELARYKTALGKVEREAKTSTSTSTTTTKLRLVPSPIAISSSLWNYSYQTIEDEDVVGIAALVTSLGAVSHLEKINGHIWNLDSTARHEMHLLNMAFDTIRGPLPPLLMSLLSTDQSSLLLDFIASPGIAGQLTVLLFSPICDIADVAQGLIKQVFDVNTRGECFRCLFLHHPESTVKGVCWSVKHFVRSATELPAACAAAERLVHCLSDVIKVLCAPSTGLLRDETFMSGKGKVLRNRMTGLWRSMCEALALLFRSSEMWSRFYAVEDMTEWMRDAVLFGDAMLREIGTLERAATSGRVSRSGLLMIGCLNDPIEALINWLRINNDELRDRSCTLVRVMLAKFAHTGVVVRQSILTKLRKLIQKKAGPAMMLQATQLIELEETVRSVTGEEGSDIDSGVESSNSTSTAMKKSSSKGIGSKLAGSRAVETITIDDDDDEVNSRTLSMAKSSSSKSKPAPASTSSKSLIIKGQTTLSFSKYSSASHSSGFPAKSSLPAKPSSLPNFGRPVMKNAGRPKGVPWTTYSTKAAQSMMESSSDDSDDEGNASGAGGLAQLAMKQKSPKIKKVEQRKVKRFEPDNPGDLMRKVAGQAIGNGVNGGKKSTAVSARLRSVQDFSDLHRQILQWDYNHDNEYPPSSTSLPSPTPRSIPTSFLSHDDHFAAFEPLLLLECWAQVRQAKAEAMTEANSVKSTIAGRQSVDDFTDVFMTVEHSQVGADRIYFSESDLILLRSTATGPSFGGRAARRQTLGKIQSMARKKDFIELTVRCHFGNDTSDASSALVAKSNWEVLKLYTMSTIHREYAALKSLPFLELSDHILQPRSPPLGNLDLKAVEKAMSNYQVNRPQAMAILGSLKNRGFSLIQGPPGTGKTSTIVGLIGAFIAGRSCVASAISIGQGSTSVTNEPTAPVAKVLLCAPSNAAVDEVAKRLKEGIRGADGHLFIPNVVRIGADSSVDISVKDIFIDELVERAISGIAATSKAGETGTIQARMQAMRAEIDSLKVERDSKKLELDSLEYAHASTSSSARKMELSAELKRIKSKIFELSQSLDREKDRAQQSRRAMDAQQRKVRLEILKGADVICATLSGSGHDYMAQVPFDFETVIIDEAAQSVELSSLIPLKYGCQRCILVGDPNQLPPTVLSRPAARAGYERSMFVRMMNCAGPASVHLLSIQYRMHSHISAFPSAAFYESRLLDGPSMDTKTQQAWHSSPLFPPYTFMHVLNGTEQQGRYNSLFNSQEAATAVAIYERLVRDFPAVDFGYRVGVVTPYKGQVGELKKQFRIKFGEGILSKVAFNTVDGFQGQEKDIIILSCVRGGAEEKSVGFLADTRRMNVALTRARSSLFILGDSNKLRSNQYWNNLVTDAERRGLLRQVDPSTFRSLAPLGPPVLQRGIAVVSPSKSTAKSILAAPFSNLVTPKTITAQAAANKRSSIPAATASTSNSSATVPPATKATTGSSGAVGAKRRVSEAMSLTCPVVEKKLKVENASPVAGNAILQSVAGTSGSSHLPLGSARPLPPSTIVRDDGKLSYSRPGKSSYTRPTTLQNGVKSETHGSALIVDESNGESTSKVKVTADDRMDADAVVVPLISPQLPPTKTAALKKKKAPALFVPKKKPSHSSSTDKK